MAVSFFDSNVLLYLVSTDTAKADRAEGLVAGGGAVSVQVLNELAAVARRKTKLSWQETHGFLETIRALLTVHPLTLETHDTGLDLAQHYGFSVYDAMIAAAALHAGSDTLWSEDFQHGMNLGEGLTILNPFR